MMNAPNKKIGKLFLVFAGLCIVTMPLVIFAAISQKPPAEDAAVIGPQRLDFDNNGVVAFETYLRLSDSYLEGNATGRNLSQYYARRQYPGSPPLIPHPVQVRVGDKKIDCLTCHADGGWSQALKAETPLTPHPQQESCLQCHVKPVTDALFKANDWQSIRPPRLGRAHLPGAPPPIPHELQNRGNCVACHVGPGAVTEIRVHHRARGDCRQCHVPDQTAGLFQRPSKQR